MTKPFNEDLFSASIDALTEKGVPFSQAIEASIVVASDEPGKPNLGRSEEEQTAIDRVLPYLQK